MKVGICIFLLEVWLPNESFLIILTSHKSICKSNWSWPLSNQVQSAWYEPSPDCIWICTFHRHCKKGLGTKKFALSSYWSTHQGRKYDTYKYSNVGDISIVNILTYLDCLHIILGSDTRSTWVDPAAENSSESFVQISSKYLPKVVFL